MATTLELHFFVQVAMWYFFSIMFNIEVKRIFNHYDIPWTVSLTSFVVACVGCASIMGREKKSDQESTRGGGEEDDRPRSPEIPYKKLIFVGLLQFLGNFATNLSIQAMSVSFTHVVKATEVIFVLVWSYVLVRYGIITRVVTVSGAQVVVIMLITVGVMIASLKEATFSWHGLIFGMLANVGFSGRNTLAKWVMSNHHISKERVFVIASFVSCVPCILPVLMWELPTLATVPRSVFLSVFYTSVMYFLYNTVSFTVLEGVSPVTHAIANCCKRLFIMVASMIVFRTVIQPLNIVGSLIAIFGVALYSQLSSTQTLVATIKKNFLFILLGSLIVVGVLLIPQDPSVQSGEVIVEDSLAPVVCPEYVPPPVAALEKFVPKKRGNSELIKHLQGEIVRILKPHFKGIKQVVILDVPDHNNKGDSAIFTGEDQFLRLIGVEIVYACSDGGQYGCNIDKIKQLMDPKTSLICLHGGGNFGDLWSWVVDLRNGYVKQLLAAGYENFLMFPQTITFRDKGKVAWVRDLYAKMKKFIFTVRDIPSLNFLKENFPNATPVYMPDIAWVNGHKEIARTPTYDLLFFLRTDHEGEKLGGRVQAYMQKVAPDVKYKIDDWTNFDVHRGSNPLIELNYDRFYSGLDFLTQAKVVLTNRLHGHILSTLLDLPHVIVDNIYGKVFDNHHAWTLNATGVEEAEDIEEGIDKALMLLADLELHEE